MRNKIFLSLIVLLSAGSAKAQNYCGTELSVQQKQWLTYYSQHRDEFKGSASLRQVYYIPVKVHIVGQSNGTGYYPLVYLWEILCELNQQYIPVGFHFYLFGDIHYINSDLYFEHNFGQGQSMMSAHNVDGAVNVYFVGDPAGTCGYFSPAGDAVAVKNTCTYPGSTTLAHELGHFFSLPHPFDRVNEVTEFVDGSNCNIGGDLFCDTPADFLDYRWPCPYSGNETDPKGDVYEPDETLYMSYSYDECQSRFSEEQIDAMINYLLDDRDYLLDHATPNTMAITGKSEFLSPSEDAADVPNDWVEFKWSAVPGADFYYLQATKYFTFSAPSQINAVVYGTSYTTWLEAEEDVMWRVKPLNEGYTCAAFSDTGHFTTVIGTGIQEGVSAENKFSIYPNLTRKNGSFQVAAASDFPQELLLIITSSNGQIVQSESVSLSTGSQVIPVSVHGLAPGMYLVRLIAGTASYQQKLVVTD